MGEFHGSLKDIGLFPILNFLQSLGKSGSLRLSQGLWTATIALRRGQVISASFGDEQGVSAL